MTLKVYLPEDILPIGEVDPMLMTDEEVTARAVELKRDGNVDAANFLYGVVYARVSLRAAGVDIPQ